MPPKTQQELQVIFNLLVSQLEMANTHNQLYFAYDLVSNPEWSKKLPVESYLDALKEKLTFQASDELFYKSLYHRIFHTGPVPDKHNHVLMTSKMKRASEDVSSPLTFWFDIDEVATLLNEHFNISPHYHFKVSEVTSLIGCSSWTGNNLDEVSLQRRHDLRLVYNSSTINRDFLIGCMITGMLSAAALLVVALAVASMITLSTASIGAAVGVGFVSGIASYGFFKAKDVPTANTKTVTVVPGSECIEDVFQNHFKDFMSVASTNEMV
ncbi:MAG: hypothetical protein P1U61_01905 [Legionellaceae bacterium]|nr:hypothetical protein [Legionellaceae bacterium]